MFFNGIAYFFEQIYSQLNTTEADYSPYGLFSQPLFFVVWQCLTQLFCTFLEKSCEIFCKFRKLLYLCTRF